MRALVTGAAGFIGSHLTEALLARGDQVRGIDSFTDYYEPTIKASNLRSALEQPGFELIRADVLEVDVDELLSGVDVVFHQAGQPGVRLSWADGFHAYVASNITATQRLLEGVRSSRVSRFVYASSSSIYGNAERYPCSETDVPSPHSPYGVTKLAAEHLCRAYASNFDVPTVSLRYFTVYGPRQRPDMAFHRMIEAGLGGPPFPLFGDGSAWRDFTYVSDVVAANLAAADADIPPGAFCNIAGGGSAQLADLIDHVGELLGHPVPIERHGDQVGDVARTGGDITLANELLGWSPEVDVRSGLARQVAWHRALRGDLASDAPTG